MWRVLGVIAAVAVFILTIVLLFSESASAQQTKGTQQSAVPRERAIFCWPIANGMAQTLQCDNGYWITTMPDGTVIDGNGIPDPNANQLGSRITIDPGTSRPTGNVIPPEPITPTPAPGQWYYGFPPPQ